MKDLGTKFQLPRDTGESVMFTVIITGSHTHNCTVVKTQNIKVACSRGVE